jgi:hypothetical protein
MTYLILTQLNYYYTKNALVPSLYASVFVYFLLVHSEPLGLMIAVWFVVCRCFMVMEKAKIQ